MSDTHSGNDSRPQPDLEADMEASLTEIRGVLRGLRFGSVTIIVQDGVVVQIDRLENAGSSRTRGGEKPRQPPEIVRAEHLHKP